MPGPVAAPLSPPEEIALRQLATTVHHGAPAVAPHLVQRLHQLGLVERVTGGWRLTPLGELRFRALPQPLLRRKTRPVIESILDRYVSRAQALGIARPEEPADGVPVTPDEADQKPRILVAEDSCMEADALAELLDLSGYEVVGPTARVQQALALATEQRLDAALLDIDLHGETSFSVASALQQRGIPLAFVSAYDPRIVPATPELRSVPFIAKPFAPEVLVNVVKSLAPA
jgi:CheY-like chemotaxis protein